MSDEKGIQGFKKAEFVNPERVFGEGFQADDLPDGVRAYMREKALNLGGRRAIVNAYRVVDTGGLKLRRKWAARMDDNRVPEDYEIAERCGPGQFIWIMKFEGVDGKDQGIMSDTIDIDEDSGRAMHEAWKRRQASTDSTPVAPAAVPAASVSNPMGFGMESILKIMAATEEKTLATMERMMAMANSNKSETPADVLKGVYEGANAMMQKAVETNLQMVNQVRKSQSEVLAREAEAIAPKADPEDEDGAEGGDGPQVPEFIKPFMPMLEKGLAKLLGGGPQGALTKALILSDDEFQSIFSNPDKWGQLVAYLERTHGSEKTKAAMDILLNRRDVAAGKSAKKGKGK